MKLLLLTVLTLISCNSNSYLSKSEILDKMKSFSPEQVQTRPLDDDAIWRKSNLTSLPVFFRDLPINNIKLVGDIQSTSDVDLRNRDTPIKTQDNGKCTAYGGVAALENALQSNGIIEHLDLSEWHAWSFYQEYSAQAFIKALLSNKIGYEKDYPQYGRPGPYLKGLFKLKEAKYIGSNVNAMVEALKNGHPVYLAIQTPEDLLRCNTIISPYTNPENGGHAVLVSGFYYDEKVLGKIIAIIKNSWGSHCGDHGYQYVPLGHICGRSDFYCAMWIIEV